MLNYNTGYVILSEGDNPNDFSELQGSQKQTIAINKVSGNIWIFNNIGSPKWTLATPFARNVGDGVEVTKDNNGVLQFKTLESENDTCEIRKEGNYIDIIDYNHNFSCNRTSFTDVLRQSLVMRPFQNVESIDTPLLVNTVDTVNKTFTLTTTINNINFNPLQTGEKWIAYRINHTYTNGKFRPKWIINKVVNGVFYYDTIVDANESYLHPRANVDYIEFVNPFINYKNTKEDNSPLFSEIAPGETFEGYTIQYNNFIGLMNRGSDYVAFITITVDGETIYHPQRRYLVYTTTEDFITWSDLTILNLMTMDIENLSFGSSTLYTILCSDITYLDEAGKSSDKYLVKCVIGLIDNDLLIEYFNAYFILDEDLNVQNDSIYALTNPTTLGECFTKFNGRFRSMYRDSLTNNIYERIIEGEIEDILENPLTTNPKLNIITNLVLDISAGNLTNIGSFFTAGSLHYKYIHYENKLHISICSQMNYNYGAGSHILKAHPNIYIGTLNDNESTWIWNKTNPYLVSPMNWHLINNDYATKYGWQSAGITGFYPFSFENKKYFFGVFSESSLGGGTVWELSSYPQIGLFKFNDFSENNINETIYSILTEVTSSTYTQKDEKVILCDNSIVGGNITITLKPQNEWGNKELLIKKLGGGYNITIVRGNSSDTIDGIQQTLTITTNYDSILLRSVGDDIIIIS